MTEAIGQEQTFTLQILTPGKMVEDTYVSIATLPGVEGDFGVLAGHMPFITNLGPGVVSYEEGGMPRRIAVSAGIVEVIQTRVIILARTAETVDEIDIDRARKTKESCEAKLSGMTHDHEDWAAIEVKLLRAIARIEVAKSG